jgi:hypothetical protein
MSATERHQGSATTTSVASTLRTVLVTVNAANRCSSVDGCGKEAIGN